MSTLTEIMTKNPEMISGDTLVIDAARKMRDVRIGALLVKNKEEVIGILTDTDITRKAVAGSMELGKVSVENIMSTPLQTIESVRGIRDAQDMMGDLGIRHLAVCEAGKVVGVVSVRDLLVYFRSMSEPKIGQD